MKGYIYCLSTDDINDAFYIGATVNPANRVKAHRGNYPFYLNGFKVQLHIIDEVEVKNRKELSKVEMYWMQQFISWGFELENTSLGYGINIRLLKQYIDIGNELFPNKDINDDLGKETYEPINPELYKWYKEYLVKTYNKDY